MPQSLVEEDDVSSNRTILVVDDQPDIRLMCRVNLALEGYQVVEAVDGEEAKMCLHEHQPDLVLLDVMMPGIDGWEILTWMKGTPEFAGIPVVMLTARVQREDELKGWSLGVSDYLPKPFNPSSLTQVVNRVIVSQDDPERRRRAIEKLTII